MIAPLSLETLRRLPERGAGGLGDILRTAARGDWRTRALCLSAAGQIIRADPFTKRIYPFRHWIVRRVPVLRPRFPSAGYHGKYFRNLIANALVDRSWVVRTAAALALGECRAPSMIEALRPLLSGPYRAERIAAAAAIASCGASLAQPGLGDGSGAPLRIGDTTSTLEFLTVLAAGHLDVLNAWPGSERPAAGAPEDWAVFLAGAQADQTSGGAQAEIERYDANGDTEYLLTKPFSPINRVQNARLLHAFLLASEQLRVPKNGRVLDLGGGSAWVSELLVRFGLRPVTLDLSFALLSVGRQRFSRAGLPARFTVGDMTRLPIATGSVDAAIVMDALHHVPDVPAVFAEVYRVLVDGGQFVLAEPGEGHADTEKSLSEIREHGVHEREIHLFEAITYGRKAGFSDIRIVPHLAPLSFMTPEDVEQAMVTPADEWVMRNLNRPDRFPQLVLQPILDRPIIVFHKGQRPVDSLVPGTLRGEIVARLDRDGPHVRGRLSLRNTGDTLWRGGGDQTGQVRVGIQLCSPERELIDREFSRVRLARSVPPGSALDVAIDVTLPTAGQRYVLKIDLVDEGICWFEDGGSNPIYLAV